MSASEPSFDLEDYDFELPERLIAQTPAERRRESRLMVLDRGRDEIRHARFADLPEFLAAGDLLVVNTTRVVPGRLAGRRLSTGGRLELLLEAPTPDGELAGLVRSGGRLRPGELLEFAGGELVLELLATEARGRRRFRRRPEIDGGGDLAALLERHGRMPLPPYIRRERGEDPARDALDRERYQTVYARRPGAVAAPTAGLHFDEDLLRELERRGIGRASLELAVGLGTFTPIEERDFRRHAMHAERFEVDEEAARAVNACRASGGRVVAVGTTSVRSLESAWDEARGEVLPRIGETAIFIHPPMRLRAVDALVTNFHLPKSSLLLLLSAFAGRDRVLAAYEEAVREEYRFFSYGDAMLVL
ncbi:MAG: tRNA preQ1(34) S-adenosylmethionine ribosyltransferase-isomerase QueA [Planctomycetota bacterium]